MDAVELIDSPRMKTVLDALRPTMPDVGCCVRRNVHDENRPLCFYVYGTLDGVPMEYGIVVDDLTDDQALGAIEQATRRLAAG